MKTISGLAGLREYGIEILTGEACGLGLRLLCDVTEKGRKLLSQAYGIPNLKLAEAWNGRSLPAPHTHVGSILLDPSDYLFLGIFALLEAGCTKVYQFYPRLQLHEHNRQFAKVLREVKTHVDLGTPVLPAVVAVELRDALYVNRQSIVSEHTLYGATRDYSEDYLAAYLEHAAADGWTFRSYTYGGTARDRNVHQMSGRVE